MKHTLYRLSSAAILAVALLIVLWLSLGRALALRAPASDAVAGDVQSYLFYQGRLLTPGGAPVPDGSYPMSFRLYTQLVGGTAVVTDTHAVTATSGLFRTYMDFPPELFNGQALWVGVQIGADAEMAPRHYLRPVPYALSLRPGAIISATLNGEHTLNLANGGAGRALSAQAATGSAIVGGNASPDKPAVAGVNSGAGPGGFFSSAGGDALKVQGNANVSGDLTVNGYLYAHPVRNLVTVAKAGGDFTTIQAALDSITNASDANPYLVHIMPGVYDEAVTLKPWVTVEGSGRGTTVISRTLSGSPTNTTVTGASNTTLRDLSVVANITAVQGYAIQCAGTSGVTIERISVYARGVTDAMGIWLYDGADAEISDIAVLAEGASVSTGILVQGSSLHAERISATGRGGATARGMAVDTALIVDLVQSAFTARDGTVSTVALYPIRGTPELSIRNCTLTAIGAHAYGLFASQMPSAPPLLLEGSTVKAVGTSVEAAGVAVSVDASAVVRNCTITADMGAASGNASAAVVANDAKALIERSRLTASGGTETRGASMSDGGKAEIVFSSLTASGSHARGIRHSAGGASVLRSSVISATATLDAYGIHNTNTSTATTIVVDGGWVLADDIAVMNDDSDYIVRVMSSLLSASTAVSGTGTFHCLLSHSATGLLDQDCHPVP